jgi:hypothetical protein
MAPTTKIRTNYIKLSLTDKEYDNLVAYSEEVNKTISGAVRDIIDLASDVGILYGIAKDSYMELKKSNDPKIAETEDHLLTLIKNLPFKAQMDFYAYLSKLDKLAPFSKDWKSVDKKVLIK